MFQANIYTTPLHFCFVHLAWCTFRSLVPLCIFLSQLRKHGSNRYPVTPFILSSGAITIIMTTTAHHTYHGHFRPSLTSVSTTTVTMNTKQNHPNPLLPLMWTTPTDSGGYVLVRQATAAADCVPDHAVRARRHGQRPYLVRRTHSKIVRGRLV